MQLSRYNVTADVGGRVAVHNGVSGSLTLFDPSEWRRVEAFCAGTDDGAGLEERLEQMVRDRVLTGDDVNELDVLRSRYLRGRHGGGLGFTIVTSLGCNFECGYCFEDKKPSKLRAHVANAIVALVEAAPQSTGAVTVTWMGGEPLLAADELFALSDRLIRACTAKGFRYQATIVTNGWYLDETTARKLAAHGVTQAQITLDGPDGVHDRYRPHVSGRPTYQRVAANVEGASRHLRVAVRANLDRGNVADVERLLDDLAARGLQDRIRFAPSRMTDIAANPAAPVASYCGSCMGGAEYAKVELAIDELAARRGFRVRELPGPIATPCTAVRATEMVVGPEGELWKCWDDIGDPAQAVGTITDPAAPHDGLRPWLTYDPFTDPDCSRCVALPGCMGGCAHHFFHGGRDERCGTFRHNHVLRVEQEARRRLGLAPAPDLQAAIAACARTASVPVTIGTHPRARAAFVGAGDGA